MHAGSSRTRALGRSRAVGVAIRCGLTVGVLGSCSWRGTVGEAAYRRAAPFRAAERLPRPAPGTPSCAGSSAVDASKHPVVGGSPASPEVALAIEDAGTVSIATIGGTQVRTLDHVVTSTWSPDGVRGAFVGRAPAPGVYVTNSSGSESRHVLTTLDAGDLALANGGTKLAMTRGKDVVVLNVSSGSARVVWRNADIDESPVWSDNGEVLAAERSEDIYVMNASGSHRRRLPNSGDGSNSDPGLSPDGKRVAFSHDGALYLTDVDGKNTRPLTNPRSSGTAVQPRWSHDGHWIVFSSAADAAKAIGGTGSDAYQLCVVAADGSSLSQLTHDGVESRSVSWAPDDRWIAFVRPSKALDPQFAYVVQPDGSGGRQVGDFHASPVATVGWVAP